MMGNISYGSPYFGIILSATETTSVLITLLCSIVAYYILKYFWDRRWLYYYASKMPGPPAWPIVGSALYFLGGTEAILNRVMVLFKTFRSPFAVWVGHRLCIGIAQPRDLEIVMNSALAKDEVYDFARPLLGDGLLTAPVDIWKRHRKVIMPTFNQNILNTFVDAFGEHAENLVKKLELFAGKGIFDSCPIITRCTLDILCDTVLGQKVYAQEQNSSFAHWVGRLTEILYLRMFQVWLHPDVIFNRTALKREAYEIVDKLSEFLQNVIETKKQNYRKSKALGKLEEYYDNETSFKRRKAFLDYLIELSEEGENWTDKELIEETAIITIAGSDSTGSMDSFALIMLGMHPEIQDKVYEELHSIFGDSDRRVTTEDLSKMKYLERVIKEVLRLFPLAPVIARALHKDIKLESHTLPKGASCVLGIIHTHRDPEIWPQPLKFDPDRFLPEEVAKRHPYSYVPFSGGPRNCIGSKYAMMAMKAVVSTIVRHYKISTDYKSVEDIKLKADVMIRTVDGYKISIECRKKITFKY